MYSEGLNAILKQAEIDLIIRETLRYYFDNQGNIINIRDSFIKSCLDHILVAAAINGLNQDAAVIIILLRDYFYV